MGKNCWGPCEAKDADYPPPVNFMRVAEYVFKREGSRVTITKVDGTIQVYEPSIRAMVIKFDPKRPPLVKQPTPEEINSLKLT